MQRINWKTRSCWKNLSPNMYPLWRIPVKLFLESMDFWSDRFPGSAFWLRYVTRYVQYPFFFFLEGYSHRGWNLLPSFLYEVFYHFLLPPVRSCEVWAEMQFLKTCAPWTWSPAISEHETFKFNQHVRNIGRIPVRNLESASQKPCFH